MPLPVFHVDAFTSKAFAGNPATICLLAEWLDDGLLQAVATENNLSATAFFVPRGDHYELRWFTPRCEVKLCWHAMLASAFVLLHILGTKSDTVRFETRFSGALTVSRDGGLLAMDFPALAPWTCAAPPSALVEGLGKCPGEVVQIEDNYFAVYEREEDVRGIRPDLRILEKLHPAGVAITAPGEKSDFRLALLRSELWHPGRSGNRLDSLFISTVLGAEVGQNKSARASDFGAWRGIVVRGQWGSCDPQGKCSAYAAGRVADLTTRHQRQSASPRRAR